MKPFIFSSWPLSQWMRTSPETWSTDLTVPLVPVRMIMTRSFSTAQGGSVQQAGAGAAIIAGMAVLRFGPGAPAGSFDAGFLGFALGAGFDFCATATSFCTLATGAMARPFGPEFSWSACTVAAGAARARGFGRGFGLCFGSGRFSVGCDAGPSPGAVDVSAAAGRLLLRRLTGGAGAGAGAGAPPKSTAAALGSLPAPAELDARGSAGVTSTRKGVPALAACERREGADRLADASWAPQAVVR